MPIVLKSGNLNLLEPSGPVQACNGIVLPFLFIDCASCQNYISLVVNESMDTGHWWIDSDRGQAKYSERIDICIYYEREYNTLNTVPSCIYYNMFRPFVSALIR